MFKLKVYREILNFCDFNLHKNLSCPMQMQLTALEETKQLTYLNLVGINASRGEKILQLPEGCIIEDVQCSNNWQVIVPKLIQLLISKIMFFFILEHSLVHLSLKYKCLIQDETCLLIWISHALNQIQPHDTSTL